MSEKLPKIVVVLLNWNGKKDTLECLSSLEKVDYPHFQAIVVDNGSTDGSVKEIRERFASIPILENGKNLGFAGGNNPGIEWALRKRAEWIFLLNNDTIVDPYVLSAFLQAAKMQPNAKILGAKILRYHQRDVIDHFGGYWNPSIAEFICPDAGQKDHPYFEIKAADYVCGAALFMHRSVPETIGLLEPSFFLLWEETDFCARAKRAGFEICCVPDAVVWHKVSASFTGGKPHMHYFWWRSRLLWIERNCSQQEKKLLYRTVLWPEIWKMARHFILKKVLYFFSPTPPRKQKIKRLKAGLRGVLDFFRKRFGNYPLKI